MLFCLKGRKMKVENIGSKRLTLKLIIYIFTLSVFFTLIQSGVGLKKEYDDKIKRIDNSINIIEKNFLNKLAQTFWAMDELGLKIELNSLLGLPGVDYVEILEKNKTLLKMGKKYKHGIKNKYFDLKYKNVESEALLGKLYVQLSYFRIKKEVIHDILYVIVEEFIKYFVLTLVLLFVVQKLIMRHLVDMAEFVRGFQVENLDTPLILDKKINKNKPDVLDEVSLAINQMRKKLMIFIDQKNETQKEIQNLNKTLELKVELRTQLLTEKTDTVKDLLNNAAQGFLSFDKDFLIDGEYSVECEKLLGKDLRGKDISLLLFNKNEKKIDFFKETMMDALNEKNELTSSLMLSLLPTELIINKRAIVINYKILSNNNFMLILTNVTDKKKLQTKIKKEQNTLKMIISIIGDSLQFYETNESFKQFCKDSVLYINPTHSSDENANTLHALLHTFKGLFAQLYMINTTKRIHDIESKIIEFTENNEANITLKNLIESLELENSMDEDLKIIAQTLGENFLTEHNYIKIDEELINKLEGKILAFCSLSLEQKEECDNILYDIKKIKNKSLKYYLSIYPKLSHQLCLSLNKSIHPFEISGQNNIFVSAKFKPFINSLIHVFRNSCDHGIETKEVRNSLGKNGVGTIGCEFKLLDDNLYIDIYDDGKGIELNSLKSKIIQNNLSTQEELNSLSKDEIISFIFDSNLSTQESISHLSGRGVGLSCVKSELEKLNGSVSVETQLNKGTKFSFVMPFDE